MMLNRIFSRSVWTIALAIVANSLILLPLYADSEVEGSMTEDELEILGGLRWAANGWDFSEVLEIQDSLVDSPLGRVVIDRHGIDRSTNDGLGDLIFNSPFANPEPGISVVISLWGSKIEGCFAEVIFQHALAEGQNPEAAVPTLIEMGIGGQIVELAPQPNVQPRYGANSYTYQEGEILSNQRVQRQGVLHTGRHVFAIDSTVASILSNAPAGEVKARITFANQDAIVVPIGKKTVARWRSVYSFNPYCAAPTAQVAPQATTTLVASAVAQPQSTPPTANLSAPLSNAPASSPRQTVGAVALSQIQTLDNVQLRLEGAEVNTARSYTANFVVENQSSSVFGFVPVFAKVEDAAGESVTARMTLEGSDNAMLDPGESVRGKLSVLNRPWNESGQQNLVLVIKEGTTGGRTFRIPF
jgi:hypothetical protein